MERKAFQDYSPEHFSHCYGCGRLNEQGHKIKSFWDGDESVCTVWPEPYHIGMKGIVYGGFIASIIDCHSTGTAAAAAYRREGREMGTDPSLRFVTASLHVDYLKPTPIEGPVELRSRVREAGERKVIVDTDLMVNGILCARGTVVAVKIPPSMMPME
jgi:acyl-coenzyme A thioesterase PaaI-like protein